MISRTAFDQFREIPIESANFPATTAVPASSLVRVNPVMAKKGIIDNGREEAGGVFQNQDQAVREDMGWCFPGVFPIRQDAQ